MPLLLLVSISSLEHVFRRSHGIRTCIRTYHNYTFCRARILQRIAHIAVLFCQSILGWALSPTAYRLFVQLTQAADRHHQRSEEQLAAVKALRGGIGESLTGLSEIGQRFNRKFSEKLLHDAFTNFTTTSCGYSSTDAASHVTSEAAQRG